MKKIYYFLLKLLLRIIAPWRPIVTAHIQKILVIKLCCIGDILFTTPLTRALKECLPGTGLTYMVSTWCRPLVEADTNVDHVLEFNAYEKMSLWTKIKLIIKMVRILRKKQFDLAIVLHRTPLAGFLTAFGGVPIRIGFDWQGQGFSYTHPVPFIAKAHEIDRILDCLKPLGYSPQSRQPRLEPDQPSDQAAEVLLSESGYQKQEQPLIAVFPGGGINPGTVMTSKRWMLEGYRELCSLLKECFRAQIIFIGTAEDGKIGDELLRNSLWGASIFRFEGKTSLMTLAALLKKCDLFIGGDSGPLHIADAVGIPTVSIYGPTDPGLLAPRGKQHRVIRSKVLCSPCFTPAVLDTIICKQGSMLCMTSISAEQVFEAVEELLAGKGFNRE